MYYLETYLTLIIIELIHTEERGRERIGSLNSLLVQQLENLGFLNTVPLWTAFENSEMGVTLMLCLLEWSLDAMSLSLMI